MVTLEQHITRQKLSSYLGEDGSTPLELTQEIVSNVPKEILINPKSKFLDPCAGTGTFLVVLFQKLKKFHSEEHILDNMLYACEINRFKVRMLKSLGLKNIYGESFLEKQFDMDFDVVIGNPPYNGYNRSVKLWPSFVERGFDLLKKDGFLLFITPNVWIEREGNKIRKATNVLYNNQLLFINNDSSIYFPQIGNGICSYGVKKHKSDNPFPYTQHKVTSFITLQQLRNSFKNPIVEKVFNKYDKNQKFGKKCLIDFPSTPKETDYNNLGISLTQTPEHTVKLLKSVKTTLWAKPEVINLEKWRLFLNRTSYYYVENDLAKYMPIMKGVGCMCFFHSLGFDTEQEALNARSYFGSKLYRYVIEYLRPSNTNFNVIEKLPVLENKLWTDQELYQHFNLTQEEIDLIEKTIN